MNDKDIKIIKGNIIFTKTIDKIETIKDGFIILNKNKIVNVLKELPNDYSDYYYEDFGNKLIIPGLVDLHVHAPQFSNRGLGLDMELLPWLNTYTFPEEAKFSDKNYAIKIYQAFINALWKNGVTRSVVFSSIHIKTTELLFKLFIKSGLGAYVGKVNMDYALDPNSKLIETTTQSLADTEYFIKKFNNEKELVKPIITPRFALSCTRELLKGLGNLSKKYQVPVQTHLSENKDEVIQTKARFPEIEDYIDIYINSGLLDNKSVLAHCVLSPDSEIEKIKKHNSFIAHCPYSNLNLVSGIAPVKDYLEKKVNVGLGSDVSAGHTHSIIDNLFTAVQVSKVKWLENQNKPFDQQDPEIKSPLKLNEAFYLATKGGGKFFGKVGSFEPDYEFDALIIDDSSIDTSEDVSKLTLEQRLERFIYLNRSEFIKRVYVAGKVINKPFIEN